MGFFRVILNGNTPAPGEVWSVGTSWIGPNTEIPFPDLKAWADGIAAAIVALSGNTLISILSATGSITEIRVEQRDVVTDELIQAAESTLATPKVGSGPATKTLQTSAVISLITAQPGRSYRGRVYWPAWAYTPTATMLFNSGDMTAWLTAFDNLHDLIKAQALVVDAAYQMVLAVRSRLLHESNEVLTLAVGNVPDVQRRRRDALAEAYTTAALT